MVGLQPPCQADTPLVTWFQSGKIKAWPWGTQIVAYRLAKFEEGFSHDGTDSMGACISCTSPAKPIPEIACHGFETTRLEWLTKNIICHG